MNRYHSDGDPYYGVLEMCLNDILSYIKPSENDRLKRLNTINELTTIVRSVESLKGNMPLSGNMFLSLKSYFTLSLSLLLWSNVKHIIH